MSEYYTVTINNSTGTEITGGRVGHFKLKRSNPSDFVMGDSTLSVTYGPTNLVGGMQIAASPVFFVDLYVTSPDDVYVLFVNGGGAMTDTLEVFHSR